MNCFGDCFNSPVVFFLVLLTGIRQNGTIYPQKFRKRIFRIHFTVFNQTEWDHIPTEVQEKNLQDTLYSI